MPRTNSSCVVVLGDIGRSPRMQNHVHSLVQHRHTVHMVGYLETQPPSDLVNHPNVHLVPISTFSLSFVPSNIVLRVLFLIILPLLYVFKFIQLSLSLSFALLFRVPNVDQVLLQTPPAMPATMIVRVCCWIKDATFVLDWHNLGFTLFRHKVIPSAFLRWMEFTFGRTADVHLCVSKAMKEHLEETIHKPVHVLYDRPHDRFCEVSHDACHRLLRKHQDLFRDALAQFRHSWKKIRWKGENDMCEETLLTFKSNDMAESKPIEMRRNRPFLIVTSTSYTADEDLGLFLRAIASFDQLMMYRGVSFVFAITGTGPTYDEVSATIADMRERLHNCAIVQAFLSADEYPTFIGCADAGICLHTSSSGLDLPMKVLDLFGVCVPVIAYEYPAISELVTKDSGFLFKETGRLINYLARLFGDSVHGHQILHRCRTFLQNQRPHFRWDEEWNRVVLPLLVE